MANNRLYLVDKETGHWIMLAKGFGEWRLWDGDMDPGELLDRFLQAHDHGAAQNGKVPTGFVLMTEVDDLPHSEAHNPLRGWRPERP